MEILKEIEKVINKRTNDDWKKIYFESLSSSSASAILKILNEYRIHYSSLFSSSLFTEFHLIYTYSTMNSLFFSLFFFFFLTFLVSFISSATFTEFDPFSSDGCSSPQAGVHAHSDNFLYSTTSAGGLYGAGALVQITPLVSSFRTIYSFRDSVDGSSPLSTPQNFSSNFLFGTTSAGGQFGCGTIY